MTLDDDPSSSLFHHMNRENIHRITLESPYCTFFSIEKRINFDYILKVTYWPHLIQKLLSLWMGRGGGHGRHRRIPDRVKLLLDVTLRDLAKGGNEKVSSHSTQ